MSVYIYNFLFLEIKICNNNNNKIMSFLIMVLINNILERIDFLTFF